MSDETLNDIEEELDATMPDDGVPPGDDTPRPTTLDSEPLPEDIDIDTGGLIEGVTAFFASRMGPKWKATPEEAKQIGDCLNGVMLKYAPIVARHQEEFALGMAVAAYFLVRITVKIPEIIQEPKPEPKPGDDAT